MSKPQKRAYCEHCSYPQSVCICGDVTLINNKTKVLVLQHPSEVKVAKNTVRLLQLSLKNIQIFQGESTLDFAVAQQEIGQNATQTALLYPNEKSLPLERHNEKFAIKLLVVIDGTWRKAYKIWQLNPWLHALPCFHFDATPTSQYQRVAKVENSLSTLEATAHALSIIEQVDYQSLNNLQATRQKKGFEY